MSFKLPVNFRIVVILITSLFINVTFYLFGVKETFLYFFILILLFLILYTNSFYVIKNNVLVYQVFFIKIKQINLKEVSNILKITTNYYNSVQIGKKETNYVLVAAEKKFKFNFYVEKYKNKEGLHLIDYLTKYYKFKVRNITKDKWSKTAT